MPVTPVPATAVPVTVVLAEDETLLRAGLTELLNRFGFAVCATAGDGPGLIAAAGGGTVVDPEVVRRLLRRRHDPLSRLTPRERDVLALIAEGCSNTAIARRLHVTETVVSKHIGSVLAKLDLPPTDDTNRRVMAVLTYLQR